MRVLIAVLFISSLLPVNTFARIPLFYGSEPLFVSQVPAPDLEKWNISVSSLSSVSITVSFPQELKGAVIERSEDKISFQAVTAIESELNQYKDLNLKKGAVYFYRLSIGVLHSKVKSIVVDEKGAWSYMGITPASLELNQVAVCDKNNIYGGFGASNGGWVFKSDKNSWSGIADPGIRISDPAITQDKDNAYMSFGLYNKVLFRYNFVNNSWSRLDSFPDYKTSVSSFVIKDKIYFAGGMDLISSGKDNWIEKPAKSLWEYDLKNQKWNRLQDLPFDSAFNCPVIIKNDIAYLLYKGKYVWEFDANNKKKSWNIYDTLEHVTVSNAVLSSGKIFFMASNDDQELNLLEYKIDARKLDIVNVKSDINFEKCQLGSSNTDLYLIDFLKGNPIAEYWIYDKNIPLAPDELVLDSISSEFVHLRWKDNSEKESGYIIERNDSYFFTPIDTVGPNTTQYYDFRVLEKTNYKYRVKAVQSNSVSEPSNIIDAVTLQAFPLQPGNLHGVSRNESSVNLTWIDSAYNESTYYIERSEDNVLFTTIDSLMSNSTEYYDSKNIKEGFTYFYRIYCVNDRGKSKLTTTQVKTVQSFPWPPNHLNMLTVSESGLTLGWRDSSFNETGYFIERSVRNNYSYQLLDSLPANATEFMDKGLQENEVYYYRVYARNFRGRSGYSGELKVKTLMAIPMAPSELSTVFKPSGTIELRWIDNSTNESLFYIERAEDEHGFYETIDSVQSDNRFYMDNKISSQPKKYYYKVCAVNSRGKSGMSNIAEVSSLLPPTDVTARALSYKEVSLNWQSIPRFETGYVIIRRTYYNETYYVESIIDTVDCRTTMFADTSQIHQNTRYGYVIYSINPTGISGISNESVTITPFATDVPSSFLVRSVYPNPCTEILYVDIKQGIKGPLRVFIIDESGKIVRTLIYESAMEHIGLDFSSLRCGSYFVKIESVSQTIYSGKVLKK